MANGIPVRLSADLAQRARAAASTLDRSVTEQVEHWARLGQVVEETIMAATVQRLKARSHDADLGSRISLAKTVAGRASAAKLIASRDKLLHGPDAAGSAPGVRARRKRSRR